MYNRLWVMCPVINGHTHCNMQRYKQLQQTTDHIIYECETLTKEREKLKTTALQKGSWPTNKKDLIRKHYRDFVKFINHIPFDKLNAE